jgi:hypothetical protein
MSAQEKNSLKHFANGWPAGVWNIDLSRFAKASIPEETAHYVFGNGTELKSKTRPLEPAANEPAKKSWFVRGAEDIGAMMIPWPQGIQQNEKADERGPLKEPPDKAKIREWVEKAKPKCHVCGESEWITHPKLNALAEELEKDQPNDGFRLAFALCCMRCGYIMFCGEDT